MQNLTRAEFRYLMTVHHRSISAAVKAMNKFPAPNMTLLKVAEEAGEVVKAGVHLSENRDFTWQDLEGEVVQTIAMCFRLLLEGDGTIGLVPQGGIG